MSRFLRVLSVVCVLVVLPVQPAKACSCVMGDPRDDFNDADGAFVGTFLESHPAEPNPTSSGADTIYSFLLEEEYKGELGDPGDTVEVHAAFSGASCGIEAQPGEQYGLFLHVREPDGVWASSLCSQVDPQTMREAASPLPAPTSEGPVRMVAGGSFGDMQTMFLDADGETVGYGSGNREAVGVRACRGSARVLELAIVDRDPPVLVVRDVSSLDAVRRVELPFGKGRRFREFSIAGAHCLSESGRRSVVFATSFSGKSMLLEVDGRDFDVLHRGTAHGVTFGDRAAYLEHRDRGHRLTRVSLRTGAERLLARLPGEYSSGLVLSPDETMLAGIAYPPYERNEERPARLFLVDVAKRRVWTTSLGTGERDAHVRWLSDGRIAMFVAYPDASRVYDLQLDVRGRFGTWQPFTTALVGDVAFGLDYYGRLWEVRLPDGEPRVSRRLPSPVVYDLSPLG